MSRDDLHFRLRIPGSLKYLIVDAAEQNHRSMTAEIVSRLEASFDGNTSDCMASTKVNPLDLSSLVTRLEAAVKALEERA